MRRRRLLIGLTGLTGLTNRPALAMPSTPEAPSALVAAWQQDAEQHVGLLRIGRDRLALDRQLVVPTRAHGLCIEAAGSVLAVARRPGDWLLRWHPRSGRTQWHWVDDDRRLNGHAIFQPGLDQVLTTETDSETGQGLLGVRDAVSLAKLAEWPTHGTDPHQLLALPERVGLWPAGTVLVANGGIPVLPETGRVKRLSAGMNSSLVALDPGDGKLLGQWRLDDPFLSIRHLAWNERSGRLGIALQAEHPQAAARASAPVLATWDGGALQVARSQPALHGYGGDISAHHLGGFAVSCPQADALALFSAEADFLHAIGHPGAYALAEHEGHGLNCGKDTALRWDGLARVQLGYPESPAAGPAGPWQFDNHWQLVVG